MNEQPPPRQAAAERETALTIVSTLVNGELRFDGPTTLQNHTLFASNGFGFHHSTAPAGDMNGTTLNNFFSLTLTVGSLGYLDWDIGDGKMRGNHVEDGEQFLWLANQSVYGCWEKPLDCFSLMLTPDFLARAAQEALDPDSIEVLGQARLRDPLVASIGHTLHRQHAQHGNVDRIYGETLATSLAVHLLRTYTTRKPAVSDIATQLTRVEMRRAIEFIHARLDTDLALTEIADAAGLSPYYFARLFKLSTGHAPHQFVINARVEKAKSLLKHSKLSVAEVAQAVGFYDHAHFIRHFKRSVGVTPSVYREN